MCGYSSMHKEGTWAEWYRRADWARGHAGECSGQVQRCRLPATIARPLHHSTTHTSTARTQPRSTQRCTCPHKCAHRSQAVPTCRSGSAPPLHTLPAPVQRGSTPASTHTKSHTEPKKEQADRRPCKLQPQPRRSAGSTRVLHGLPPHPQTAAPISVYLVQALVFQEGRQPLIHRQHGKVLLGGQVAHPAGAGGGSREEGGMAEG